MNRALPSAVETVFLDAGNTLISMDYAWVVRELAACGYPVARADLERAEAAARPATSRHFWRRSQNSSVDAYRYYLARILERLPAIAALAQSERDALGRAVAGKVKRPGEDHLLWSVALPGVGDALARMSAAGLRLVVVSNSDGSVERALESLGFTTYLDAVLDSDIVGYEKPDPRLFTHALGISGARPEATLHVGDMYYQDVLGARAAGIECVLLDPHGDWDGVDCIRRRNLGDVAEDLLADATGRY